MGAGKFCQVTHTADIVTSTYACYWLSLDSTKCFEFVLNLKGSYGLGSSYLLETLPFHNLSIYGGRKILEDVEEHQKSFLKVRTFHSWFMEGGILEAILVNAINNRRANRLGSPAYNARWSVIKDDTYKWEMNIGFKFFTKVWCI